MLRTLAHHVAGASGHALTSREPQAQGYGDLRQLLDVLLEGLTVFPITSVKFTAPRDSMSLSLKCNRPEKGRSLNQCRRTE